jgi:hypothetical protein
MRAVYCLFAAVMCAMCFAAPVLAHGLGATYKHNGDRIELEAYYDDDTAAQDARVRVEDELRQLVAEGRTDEQGRWSCARPAPGKYRIVVDAGGGHRKVLDLEIPGGDSASPATVASVPAQRSRAEFTQFPWLRIILGMAAIAGAGFASWLLLRVLNARQRSS